MSNVYSGEWIFKTKINILVFSLPILYLFIEFIWRPLFTAGKIPGIYWLFIFVQKTPHIMALVTIMLSAVLFVVQFIMRVFHRGNRVPVSEASLALLISAFIFAFIFLAVKIQYKRTIYHLDELAVAGKTYYLSAYPSSSLSEGFGLFECDARGIFCKQAYRSSDEEYFEGGFNGWLTYDEFSREVQVNMLPSTVVYKYKLP